MIGMEYVPKLFLFALAMLLSQLGSAQSALGKNTIQDRAAVHSTAKQQGKAVDDKYEALLKANPDDSKLHFEYGKILLRQKDSTSDSEALKHLRLAVKLDPENVEFNRTLYFELVRRKKYNEAVRYKDGAAFPLIGDFDLDIGPRRLINEYNRRLKTMPETQP
jgi:tetratricopeptide (TPR) repeat protein